MIDTSQTLPLALIGCVDPERWILANQITATGWSHRKWIFTQLAFILLYCQIIMTIFSITKQAVVQGSLFRQRLICDSYFAYIDCNLDSVV